MYHQPAVYQSGGRFQLGGWTAQEWATFFAGAEPSLAQIVGTVTGNQVQPVPVPVQTVATPVGLVPSWGILAVVMVGGLLLLTRGQRR